MSEFSVTGDEKSNPVDLSDFMRPVVANSDPRSWGSYAMPYPVTDADRLSAAYEAAERPMGAYVAAEAERRSGELTGASRMTLHVVEAFTQQ